MEETVTVRWLAVDAVGEDDWPTLERLLDDAERTRAARFHFARDRHSFILGHALTRGLLSQVTGGTVAPADWRFTAGAHGKPEVVCPPGLPHLRVNLSHTRGMAVVALTVGHDVGVDVEWLGRSPPTADLADRFFAPAEAAVVKAAPEAERGETFLAFWTLKEALIKAVGTGLSHGLDSFAFTLEPLTLRFEDGADDPARWLVHRLRPGPDHMMALAARCPEPARLRVSAEAMALGELTALAP